MNSYAAEATAPPPTRRRNVGLVRNAALISSKPHPTWRARGKKKDGRDVTLAGINIGVVLQRQWVKVSEKAAGENAQRDSREDVRVETTNRPPGLSTRPASRTWCGKFSRCSKKLPCR